MNLHPADAGIWDRDAYLTRYHALARGFAINHWNRPITNGNADDIAAIGTDGLMAIAETYPDWCEKENVTPGGGTFWTLVKKRILWDTITQRDADAIARTHLRLDESDNPDDDDDNESRTDLVSHREPSMTHAELVDYLDVLPLRWKCILALRFFEQLDWATIAEISGESGSNSYIVNAATTALVKQAKHLWEDNAEAPAPILTRKWSPPDKLEKWIADGYRTDLQTYIGLVHLHYRADVSYLVDMLDVGNGHRMGYGNRGKFSGRIAPCGTMSAWTRHRRRDEAVDEACQKAYRESLNANRERSRPGQKRGQ